MADPDFLRHPAWWGLAAPPADRPSLAGLVAGGILDPQLAALVWLLAEERLPLVVAGAAHGAGKTALLSAVLELLPPGGRHVVLGGAGEDFAWLPEAAELGWPGRPHGAARSDRAAPAAAQPEGADAGSAQRDPGAALILAPELSDHLPGYTWGLQARTAVRALQLGYGFAATLHADSLAEALSMLAAPPVGLADDEVRRLGVVLVLRRVAPGARRVVAAHYLRPLERDGGGHLQRRPPAVLATWDPATDAFEHFAWGVMPELALRIGRSQAELEREQARRAAFLADLVAAGRVDPPSVRRAVGAYRAGPHAPGAG